MILKLLKDIPLLIFINKVTFFFAYWLIENKKYTAIDDWPLDWKINVYIGITVCLISLMSYTR